MKKKVLWTLLALAVVVILILVIAQPRGDSAEKTAESGQASSDAQETGAEQAQEPAEEDENAGLLSEGELPLDVTQPKPANETTGDQSSTPAPLQAEPSPNVDPGTGMELEEDELPLDIP